MQATETPTISSTDRPTKQLPPLMQMYFRWALILLAVSICFHLFIRLALHHHGYASYPFTQDPSYRFADFWIFKEKFSYFHTLTFFQVGFPINYPAPACVGFEFFFKFFPRHYTRAFESFILLSLVVPAIFFGRALTYRGIAPRNAWLFVGIVWPITWPVLLLIDGGNAEIMVWLTMVIAMWGLATGRGWIAACFFGIAASLKLFPFVFLALFLTRKQFPKLLAGAATFFVVSIGSLAILGPTISAAFNGINYGLNFFRVNYMAKWHTLENGVDHSLFAFIKFTLVALFRHNQGAFANQLHWYLLIIPIGGTLAYFLYIRKLPLLNQVLILSIVSIYLTPFSGDGTLIHLVYPLVMMFFLAIQAWRDGVVVPGLKLMFGCMVFCLSVDSFFVVPHVPLDDRFIGPMHCLGLTVLIFAALRYGLGPPLSENRGETVLSHPVTGWVKSAS